MRRLAPLEVIWLVYQRVCNVGFANTVNLTCAPVARRNCTRI